MVKKVCKYKSAITCGHIESKLAPCPDWADDITRKPWAQAV